MNTEFRELAAQIDEACKQKDKVHVQFNVIEPLHANENAHTRILVQLLQEDKIARSFLRYLFEECVSSVDDTKDLIEKADSIVVEQFTSFMDAKIIINGKTVIIIENKIKDAVDQDAQIDRYVKTVRDEGFERQNIYVLYLTKDGSKTISSSSFSESKSMLDWSETSPGRFLSLNYRYHILPWLKDCLLPKVQESNNQKFLESGIVQYIHYLKGPDVLNIREFEDTYQTAKKNVSDRLKNSCECLDEFRAWCCLELLRTRVMAACGYLTNEEWVALPKDEKQEVLYFKFSSLCKQTHQEGSRYEKLNSFDKFAVSMGDWSGLSPTQIDFWSDDGSATSRTAITEIKEKVSKITDNNCFLRRLEYSYNDCPAIRFPIENINDVRDVLGLIGVKVTDDIHAEKDKLNNKFFMNNAYLILMQIWKGCEVSKENVWGRVDFEEENLVVNSSYSYVIVLDIDNRCMV